MKTVAIIRERGQLTIPDSVRKIARWLHTSAVVSITIENPQEVVITPHQPATEAQWENLLELIKKSRSIKGKGGVSASDFIIRDRRSN